MSKSVKSIGECAFNGCAGLTSISIPDRVTSLGTSAFSGCTNLSSISVDENNKDYSSVDGILFNRDKTSLLRYPIGKQQLSYTIPDKVASIGEFAFNDCASFTSISISKSVKSIGAYAFHGCASLTNIFVPDSVSNIACSAFDNCVNLSSINVDENNKDYSSVDGILFNKDKTSLLRYPIGKQQLSYIIPSSVTSIGEKAFEKCKKLTSITIPDSVKRVEAQAFGGLTNMTIPKSVTNISVLAFVADF
ncbi:MAG: leucine-rich repeat domain-containing protein [Firmicutes bacterium]|nr:leucine-rich repeat domain-containing protein [Bacillota bacterium]